jgi:hypothetical protein
MKKFIIKCTEYRHVNPYVLWDKSFYARDGRAALDLAKKDYPYIENGKWNAFVFPEDMEAPILNTPESFPYRLISAF